LLQRCGLLDRSDRGKLALTGSGAAEFLNGQVTNDVLSLSPGEGCYAAFLTHKGKMLGDLRILATESELLLDTERVALQPLFDMIRRFKIGYDVELHKRTLERGLISLIGPTARAVIAAAIEVAPGSADADGSGLPEPSEHSHLTAQIAGAKALLISTAAPEGMDVLCDSSDTERVIEALLSAGAERVEQDAVEVVRVEAGTPRYGTDLDDSVIPEEAGLNERAVSFTKGCYVGQETVARLHYKGKPNRHLRGLRLSAPLDPGAELRLDGRLVGHLTSSVISPTRGPIGLALLRKEAGPTASLSVAEETATAEVVGLPF